MATIELLSGYGIKFSNDNGGGRNVGGVRGNDNGVVVVMLMVVIITITMTLMVVVVATS